MSTACQRLLVVTNVQSFSSSGMEYWLLAAPMSNRRLISHTPSLWCNQATKCGMKCVLWVTCRSVPRGEGARSFNWLKCGKEVASWGTCLQAWQEKPQLGVRRSSVAGSRVPGPVQGHTSPGLPSQTLPRERNRLLLCLGHYCWGTRKLKHMPGVSLISLT